MEGFELGKSIQEIMMRLERIEVALAGGTSSGGGKAKHVCEVCKPAAFRSAEQHKANLQLDADHQTFTAGRIDAGECECREQTLTIFPDGRFTHVAVHHNHSNRLDDGDTHRLTVHVRAGAEIVETIGSSRFVPRGKDRTQQTDGVSENIRRRYNDITGFDGSLECD